MKDQLETYTSELKACVDTISEIIDVEKREITNKELLYLGSRLGSIFEGTIDSHFLHELGEAALNFLIKRKYARKLFDGGSQIENLKQILDPVAKRLPTQTWRSRRQNALQQFSTPPAISFLAAYLLNIKPSEQILEPSAGTGNLAVWASELGVKVHTNEIEPRRVSILRLLGFNPTSFDAEFINDLLPAAVCADIVMMNPPFSSNGERTKNNSCKFGFRHVESALERLKKGGKFSIILGEAASLDTKSGNDFWRKMSEFIKIKAIIEINGREYYKNGTSVNVNLIIGKKLLEGKKLDRNEEVSRIICVKAKSVEEAFEQVNKQNLRLE